jgi:hypothetical protein
LLKGTEARFGLLSTEAAGSAARPTSASPRKLTSGPYKKIGRDVPISDILILLFDHLVGGSEQIGRDLEPENFRCIQIDYEPELCRVLNWKIGWLFAFEDSQNVRAGATIKVGVISAIPNQRALSCDRRPCAYHRKGTSVHNLNDLLSVPPRKSAWL